MPEFRKMLAKIQLKLRGIPTLDEELTSASLRTKFSRQHNIFVGMYSYGCFSRKRIDPETIVGRYCSFASTATVFNRNHGISFIGTNAYLYNPKLGVVDRQMIEFVPCNIGDDVWIGHNAIILPRAAKVGRGAVVAAGAVVTGDVPPYAIVAGNPAKIIGYRFSPDVIVEIEKTQWWKMDPEQIRAELEIRPNLFFQPSSVLAGKMAHN